MGVGRAQEPDRAGHEHFAPRRHNPSSRAAAAMSRGRTLRDKLALLDRSRQDGFPGSGLFPYPPTGNGRFRRPPTRKKRLSTSPSPRPEAGATTRASRTGTSAPREPRFSRLPACLWQRVLIPRPRLP